MPPKSKYTKEIAEKIKELYIDKKMSTTDISKESLNIFNLYISTSSVYFILIKNNIPVRSKSESISLATSTCDNSVSYLDEPMIEWIDGFLLGDGGIRFTNKYIVENNGEYPYSRFHIGSIHKEWAEYGISKFTPYHIRETQKADDICERRPNPLYSCKTLGHNDIKVQAERWYPPPKFKKIVPKDVRITPTSVMLWYLGDGTLINHHNLSLATCGFSEDEINNILIAKLEDLGIHSTIRRWKHYCYLVIRRNSIGKFFDFIGHKSPISCYDYKFNFEKWYSLSRISDIARDQREIWRAQWYCKNNMIEFSRSPGNKFFLFNEEQADKLRCILEKGTSVINRDSLV